MRLRLLTAMAFLVCSMALRADTLAGITSGTSLNVSAASLGQSFTVAGSGAYQNIVFNFYTGSLTPFAAGTGYLFSQAYSGTPAGLSSATTGFLGSASSSGGLYSFASSLLLLGGNQYFFYEDISIPVGSISGNGVYSGGNISTAALTSSVFRADTSTSTNFAVTGTPAVAATPEPSSVLLLGSGLLGIVGIAKRRFA